MVPRLAKFARRHPDIEIAVETGVRPVDLKREPVDLAVRHGLGKYPGLNAIRLVAPELIVVASPDLLKNRAPLREPAECLAFPLLHDLNRQDWPLWFEAHGVAAPDCKKGPAFSENHLILRAAVAGQGLALVRDIYAEDDVRSKKKGAYGELASAIRVLRRRDIRGLTEARRSPVSGLVGRGGASRALTGAHLRKQ
jgi:LysR family glycine cleavage system transcriptional activator